MSAGVLREQIESASPDLLRAMVKTFADALMSAEADAACGAGYGQRSPDRITCRNGYRQREWDTRAGTIELAIRSCGPAATARTGCCSIAAEPSRRWYRWWPRRICWGCRPGGWYLKQTTSLSAGPGTPGRDRQISVRVTDLSSRRVGWSAHRGPHHLAAMRRHGAPRSGDRVHQPQPSAPFGE
jgi:hypothetical protein